MGGNRSSNPFFSLTFRGLGWPRIVTSTVSILFLLHFPTRLLPNQKLMHRKQPTLLLLDPTSPNRLRGKNATRQVNHWKTRAVKAFRAQWSTFDARDARGVALYRLKYFLTGRGSLTQNRRHVTILVLLWSSGL